eukprot:TRINITY_DN55748_c0_g1_i1.p1 TRINITY_DN55748_c0_g1~~TRINITY_DN55748_c0_g1_i1.p1  ORF type:complete len:668 (-),score=94.29 TRINITY_DN55748_c0_g1_i1:27-2030(-)
MPAVSGGGGGGITRCVGDGEEGGGDTDAGARRTLVRLEERFARQQADITRLQEQHEALRCELVALADRLGLAQPLRCKQDLPLQPSPSARRGGQAAAEGPIGDEMDDVASGQGGSRGDSSLLPTLTTGVAALCQGSVLEAQLQAGDVGPRCGAPETAAIPLEQRPLSARLAGAVSSVGASRSQLSSFTGLKTPSSIHGLTAQSRTGAPSLKRKKGGTDMQSFGMYFERMLQDGSAVSPTIAAALPPSPLVPCDSVLVQIVGAWDTAALLLRAVGWLTSLRFSAAAATLHRVVTHASFAFPLWFPLRLYALGGSATLESRGARTTGTLAQGAARRSAERFDPVQGVWEPLPHMLAVRTQAAAVVAGGFVYAIGGRNGRLTLADVERFDPSCANGVGEWSAFAPLLEPRFGAAASVLCGVIYVAGGHDGRRALASVERLDPTCHGSATGANGGAARSSGDPQATAGMPQQHQTRWVLAPKMCVARAFPTLAVRERTLFAIGGIASRPGVGVQAHFSVERLDLEASTWRLEGLPPSSKPRVAAAVTFGTSGLLISAGGFAEADESYQALATVEYINADATVATAGNSAGDQSNAAIRWSSLPSMHCPRLRAGAAAADGVVYVIGGSGRGGEALASVERLVGEDGQAAERWEACPDMSMSRDGPVVVMARF